MNQNQKKYALNRIEGLERIKVREAEEKYTSKEIKLSNEEAYKLIATGKVKLYPFDKVHRRNYGQPDLYPSFDFRNYEQEAKLDTTKFNPIMENICKIAQQAKDQIMLGDCAEAMKLINKLEEIKI